jgi:hypothetical protein
VLMLTGNGCRAVTTFGRPPGLVTSEPNRLYSLACRSRGRGFSSLRHGGATF